MADSAGMSGIPFFFVICGTPAVSDCHPAGHHGKPRRSAHTDEIIGWPEGAGQPGGPLPVRIQRFPSRSFANWAAGATSATPLDSGWPSRADRNSSLVPAAIVHARQQAADGENYIDNLSEENAERTAVRRLNRKSAYGSSARLSQCRWL